MLIKCPRCDVPLYDTQREGVEVDVCPECRGVWLDRGELDKIIKRSESDDDHRRPDAYRRDDDQHRERDDHYRRDREYAPPHYQKRKSFWSELFD